MRYRRLGKTDLWISTVGFGTCQLRLVPEQQAIDTLKRGFELGVNWVHTAPDYEGTDDLVAQAIAEAQKSVLVFTQGYGDRPHFEYLFEETCRKFKKDRLEVFGIACIDDREYLQEPVWEPDGIIDFLITKKEEGRLGSIFCTTHGNPDYLKKLIKSGVFDALMLAYNPLGFHLLSYHPDSSKAFENIPETRRDIFPLAQQHQISLLIMKPLAGGLLVPGKAFPSRHRFSTESTPLSASQVLRFILNQPGVCGVVPGTASITEAEENALAGYETSSDPLESNLVVQTSVQEMQTSLCSRCGYCDTLCSQSLPVSWLFRDAYINHYPSETFETIDECRYFHLHPQDSAVCRTCEEQTCHCPYGINIPNSLIDIHSHMQDLRNKKLLPKLPAELNTSLIDGDFRVQVVSRSIPKHVSVSNPVSCQFYLHNAGQETWLKSTFPKTRLNILINGQLEKSVSLRHDVHPGTRTHLTFDLTPSWPKGLYKVQFVLVNVDDSHEHPIGSTQIDSSIIEVTDDLTVASPAS
ncbi:MAG: aldo/keto reductase [Spirulina sp.]